MGFFFLQNEPFLTNLSERNVVVNTTARYDLISTGSTSYRNIEKSVNDGIQCSSSVMFTSERIMELWNETYILYRIQTC
jgi:hypothetical protein